MIVGASVFCSERCVPIDCGPWLNTNSGIARECEKINAKDL